MRKLNDVSIHTDQIVYKLINATSCVEHGFTAISNKQECETAAGFLHLIDTTAYESQTEGRPYGCIYADNDWLNWYSPIVTKSESVSCGSLDRSHHYDCICRVPGKNTHKTAPIYTILLNIPQRIKVLNMYH